MSYVAIARKYRPSTFDEIVGQHHVTRTLENAIKLGRIHHAFLFTGARGVGKTTAARALSRALNCDKGPTATPCGECASCREVVAGSSPDVVEIDGASNNSVDDVRDLRESVRYLPAHGSYKIYIVDEVHMLSKGAFNALLKTLEEPPDHVVFIFATTEPQKIPDTILSRVQRFDFKRIPISAVSDRLRKIAEAEKIEIPDEALALIARAGEGSMRDAQSLLDQVMSFSADAVDVDQVAQILGLVDRELLYNMLEGMLTGQADRCLEAIQKVYDYGYELSEFTSEMLELIRNATLTVLSSSADRYLDVSDEEKDRLRALAQGIGPDVFVRSFQVMLNVHEEVARAPRPRLVLEMAVARLVAIRPAQPVDDLISRLGDLERRLRQGGARPRTAASTRRQQGSRDEDDDDAGPPPGPPPRGAPMAPRSAPQPPPGAAPPEPDFRLRPPPEEAEGDTDDEPPDIEPVDEPAEEQPEGLPPVAVDGEEDDVSLTTLPQPPPLRAEAEDGHRFDALLNWLHAGGVRYDIWAEDSVLIQVSPPTLTVGFVTPFTKTQAENLVRERDPRLERGLERYFPSCSKVHLVVRPEGLDALTRREQAKADYQARVRELRADLEADPLMQRIRTLLGGQLRDVVPDDGPSTEADEPEAP